MKKKTRIIFNKNEYIGSAYSKSNFYFFSLKNKISKKIYKEFVEGRNAIDFAKKELGFEFLKSKNELIKILGLNNLFKKILMFIYIKVINIKWKDYR